MKKTKSPAQLAKNASKLHKRVGELLTLEESPFKNYEIRQEYNVSSVNQDYKSNREKFDWVILGLGVVIEVHGEQHFEPICFGGMTIDEAKRNFLRRLQLDEEKKQAALEAKWAYVIVKYDEPKITLEELVDRVYDCLGKVSEGEYKPKRVKAKIQSRGFQERKKDLKWPTRKILSRKFNQ